MHTLKMKILQSLQTLPICIPNSAKTQWVVRCPYCGDSIKHQDHGHFSILIDMNSDTPMLYRCLRCNESGLLSAETMEDLGLIIDNDMARDLRRSTRRIVSSEYYQSKPATYKIPQFIQRGENSEKLYYLNERIGTSFTLADMDKIRVVLSIDEFMKENHLRGLPEVSPRTLQFLESNYIGFLSANRNRLVFRSIRSNENYIRYFKAVINAQNLSKGTFYTIPTSFDLLYRDDIHVHIAEGTFDILSIKYNLPHPEPGTHIYYASCGFNFNSIIKFLIAKGVNTNLHVHIYSDRDKSDYEHNKYLRSMIASAWLDHIYIHRNQHPLEKDYGVARSRIEDSRKKLK